MFILDLDFFHPESIPDPNQGIKKARDPDPQHLSGVNHLIS
jgi:hypothetical protein